MIENPITESEPGDIIIGSNNRNKSGRDSHPIIYLGADGESTEFFIGAMLTHSPRYGNTSLKREHFEINDPNGFMFKIQFHNSFIVSKKLLKKVLWAPFYKKGKLTNLGLAFIEELIKDLPVEEYLDNEDI